MKCKNDCMGLGMLSIIMVLVAFVFVFTKNFIAASLHWIASGVFIIAYEISKQNIYKLN